MNANSYTEISAEAEIGIKMAAERLGTKVNDVRGYFLAGGDWNAATSQELADEIVRCWNEQATEWYGE